jgi:hypothetical protein
MPQALTGLLPEELFQQNKKQAVIAFLSTQPAPPEVRKGWLLLWALWVGSRISPADYAKVIEGAVEVPA